jgi:hypothetical protein
LNDGRRIVAVIRFFASGAGSTKKLHESAKGTEPASQRVCQRHEFREMRSTTMDKNDNNTKYLEEVKKLILGKFFGKVILSVEDGRIVFLKKEQTIKF